MDLTLLAAMVVGGVSLVVLATHLTGGSEGRVVASDEAARDAWRTSQGPGGPSVIDVQRGDDALHALLRLADDRIGLVMVVGDQFACRRLSDRVLRDAAATERGITLRLHDTGVPVVQVALSDAGQRDRWMAHLHARTR